MRKIGLAVMFFIGLVAYAQAADVAHQGPSVRYLHKQHFHGQRAYSKEPVAQEAAADAKWEGAGIVTDQLPEDKGFDKHQQLRLHFIGKRPYTAE